MRTNSKWIRQDRSSEAGEVGWVGGDWRRAAEILTRPITQR